MAAIANPAAASGQWTPSLFKSGKPGSKSMLRRRIDATAALSSESLPSDLIRGVIPVRAKKMRRDKGPEPRL
jgi:hypothetical protein